MLCLSYYGYVFSSTKLEIREEKVLPGSEGSWEGRRWGRGLGRKNDPNNVCLCE
jgi:hypothetical protein